MTRVCLWGTSLGKVADEAQFLALLRLVERAAPGAGVTILARASSHSDIAGSRGVRIIPTFRVDRTATAIARSDLFIMVGGCFMEAPIQAMVCAGLAAIAKLCRTPLIGVGVTAFPYRKSWGRVLYRAVFNAMSMITVREPSARNALGDLGVRTPVVEVADPRYVLAPPPDEAIPALLNRYGLSHDKPLIGVTLRHLHDGMPDWVKLAHGYTSDAATAANRAIARALDELAPVAQLVLLPMHPSIEEDRTVATIIKSSMRTPEAFTIEMPRLKPQELIALIAHSDLIVASRLAAGMFAVATGTPVIGIAYEQRLMDLMSELGMADYVVSWLCSDEYVLQSIAANAWEQRHYSRERMRSAGRSLVDSAWTNADTIANYVS